MKVACQIYTSTALFRTIYSSCALLGRTFGVSQSWCVCNTEQKGILSWFIFNAHVEDVAGGKEAEGVWEHGVGEYIWISEGRGNGGMEEIA